MDRVLNFLLFDRHEYIHTESSGPGFSTGVENMGGWALRNLMGGGLSQYMGEHGGT